MKKVVVFLGLSLFLFNIQCDLFSGLIMKNYLTTSQSSTELDISKYLNGTLFLAQTVINANHFMADELNKKALDAKTKVQTKGYDTSSDNEVKTKAQEVLAAVAEVERQFAIIEDHHKKINDTSVKIDDMKALKLKGDTEKAMEKLIEQASIAEVNYTVVEAVATGASSSGNALQAVKDAVLVAKNSADAAVNAAQTAVTQAVLNLKSSADAMIAAAAAAAETALNAAKAEQAKAVAANTAVQAATDIAAATAQKTAAQTAANIAQSQAITASSKAKEALTLNSMGNISSDRQAIDQAVATVAGKVSAIETKAAINLKQDSSYLAIMSSSSAQAIKDFATREADNFSKEATKAAIIAEKAEDDLKKIQAEASASGLTTAEVTVKKAIAEHLKQTILDAEAVANGANLSAPFSEYCAPQRACFAPDTTRRVDAQTSFQFFPSFTISDNGTKVYDYSIVNGIPTQASKMDSVYNSGGYYLTIDFSRVSAIGGTSTIYVISRTKQVYLTNVGVVYK